jgi:hypothetical protein
MPERRLPRTPDIDVAQPAVLAPNAEVEKAVCQGLGTQPLHDPVIDVVADGDVL